MPGERALPTAAQLAEWRQELEEEEVFWLVVSQRTAHAIDAERTALREALRGMLAHSYYRHEYGGPIPVAVYHCMHCGWEWEDGKPSAHRGNCPVPAGWALLGAGDAH